MAVRAPNMLMSALLFLTAGSAQAQEPSIRAEEINYVCVPSGTAIPSGYAPLVVQFNGLRRSSGICECPSASPYALIPIGKVITVAGSWKVVKITRDLKLDDVTRHLTYFDLPPSFSSRAAPAIHSRLTGKVARRGGLLGLGMASVFLGYELYQTHVASDESAILHNAATNGTEVDSIPIVKTFKKASDSEGAPESATEIPLPESPCKASSAMRLVHMAPPTSKPTQPGALTPSDISEFTRD